MQAAAGLEPEPEPEPRPRPFHGVRPERKVLPQSVVPAQLANPFLVPDFSQAAPRVLGRLAGWELISRSSTPSSRPPPGSPASMELPEPRPMLLPPDLDLMAHQARLLASAAEGHRTFLLADEPGLGKTAQALLAAQVADAYPLLAIVPNVVKTNWAREAAMWTPAALGHRDPRRRPDVDGFADIVVVNYEVLDRHVGWMGEHGFRGLVVDEAHYIKNKKSQRSQNVLEVSDRIRQRVARPLLMALTGTPLINDIDDFRAIWQMLGWIEEKQARQRADGRARGDRLHPGRPRLLPGRPAGRRRPGHRPPPQGRRRRRHPGPPGRRPPGRARGRRRAAPSATPSGSSPSGWSARYQAALEHRRAGASRARRRRHRPRAGTPGGRARGRRGQRGQDRGDNVFTMVRKIGQAKAELAADYAVQLARSAGKVVFFAKHLDVMDTAEELFARRGVGSTSIRGDQTRTARDRRHRLVRQRPRRPRHRLLADRGRRRHQPPGRLQRRARRALVDERRADPGDRPGAPDRPARARHRVADHRRADDRLQDRRADRHQGRPGRPGARRGRRGGRRPRPTSRSRR